MTTSITRTNGGSPVTIGDRLFDELSKCRQASIKLGPVDVRPDHTDVLVFDSRKYYDQAINYQKVLILATEGKAYPPFQIKLSDLSPILKKDLDSLDAKRLESVLQKTVLRIYQDIDDDYNKVFPEDDPDSKKFRINLCKEIAKILGVKLVP